MKYIKLFLLLLCTVVVNCSYAQKTDATIIGHVVDTYSKEHLPFITVAIEGTTISTMTDETGHYFLKDLPIGEFTIIASSMGYTTSKKKVNVSKNKNIEVNFEIEEQALEIDQVVVSSTKNETNKRYSSSIVNVMSNKIFEATSSSVLTETMNFQPGLRMENTCSNCGSTQLRINGLEGQYSQVLLDSRPIFSSLAGVYGLEQLPVSMIERVEVIRGGGSALFGSSAIAGVVNIITKEPLRSYASVSNTTNILKGGAADINTSFNGSYVTSDNKAGIYLFGMVKNKDAYDRNDDGFSDTPILESETIGFRGYYKTSHYSKLTAEYHHINEYRRGGDSLSLRPHEAHIAEQLEHNIDGGGLNFEYFSPSHKHKVNAYSSAQFIKRKSYYGTNMDLNAYGNTSDKTFVLGGQYAYLYDLVIPATLTIGAEYTYNDLDDAMPGYNRYISQNTNVYGAFFQNEWTSDKFNLLIGGRLDKHNLVENIVFSPRVSMRYSPSDKVGFRASYSSGYRAPQAFNEDLHIEIVGGGVSLIELDPDLKPEYSNSFTASADLYHSFGNIQTNLLIEGFYTKLNDVFILEQGEEINGNTIWTRTNGSGAKVAGISADLKIGITSKFDLQGGYTFQKSRYLEEEVWSDDVEGTKIMFRSPDNYGYITANYDITDKFKTTLFGTYTGTMLVQHAAGYIENDTNYWTPSFWDLGVKLSYDFKISKAFNLNLNGGVKNILDSYQDDIDKGMEKDAGYIYGPTLPRSVFFGVKFEF